MPLLAFVPVDARPFATEMNAVTRLDASPFIVPRMLMDFSAGQFVSRRMTTQLF